MLSGEMLEGVEKLYGAAGDNWKYAKMADGSWKVMDTSKPGFGWITPNAAQVKSIEAQLTEEGDERGFKLTEEPLPAETEAEVEAEVDAEAEPEEAPNFLEDYIVLEQLSALGQYPQTEKDLGWDALQRLGMEKSPEQQPSVQEEAETAAAKKEAERRRRLHRMRNPELALAEGRARKAAREQALAEDREETPSLVQQIMEKIRGGEERAAMFSDPQSYEARQAREKK
jgi:hypothetical protein